MADLTLRNVKGLPLTFDEMDSNLLALDSSINILGDRVDSNYTDLSIEINNLESKLDSELAVIESKLDSELTVIDDRFDSMSLSIGGEINVEIGNLEVNIDSLNDRVDSNYAWNVAEHARIDSDISVRFDTERAWNVAEHQALSDSITAEMIARSNADSDISASIIPIVDSALQNGIIKLDASPTGGSSNDF